FRFLIYGLVLASSGTHFAVVPIIPAYAHRFGLSGLQQGMVLGATGFAALAVSLPAGALSDRLSARRLTLWAGWLMAIALVTQALAGSFPLLLASRLGFGVGYAIVSTAGLSWLAEAAPGGPGLGGTVASAGVGGGIGAGPSGILVPSDRLASPFLAAAAGMGVRTVCLGLLGMRAAEPASPAPMGTSLRAATSEPRTVAAAAAVVIAGGTTGVSGLLVPDELHAAGASTGRIGLAFAAAGVLFVAGRTPPPPAGPPARTHPAAPALPLGPPLR